MKRETLYVMGYWATVGFYGMMLMLLFAVSLGAAPRGWPWSVKATFWAEPATISAGDSSTLHWTCSRAARSATLDGESVALSGSRTVTPTETSNYTLVATGRRLSYSQMVVVTVEGAEPEPTPPDPDPEPEPIPPEPEPPAPDPEPPTPGPEPGFSLSAVGFGSAFEVGDTLSAAARDHDLGVFIQSQDGTWLTITDEVLAATHPKVMDQWAAVLAASGKKKPAVVWHNAGKVLAVDEVRDTTTAADLLALAKGHVPTVAGRVVIHGKVRLLGLKPEKAGFRYAGPTLAKILSPLAAAACPSVDLSSQCLYRKNQTGGTCVLQAAATMCEANLYVAYGKKNAIQLSPYFLANLTDGYNGTWASEAAEMIQKYGNLPWGDMDPYDRLPSGWKDKAANYKCLAVYGPTRSDPEGYIRAALHRGYVVMCGVSVGNGFDTDANGYISYASGSGYGVNHEILMVGWDQAKSRYKILNSWGKSWGVGGFAWLENRFFRSDNDLWVAVAMTAAPDYQFVVPADKALAKKAARTQTLKVLVEAVVEPSTITTPNKTAPAATPKQTPCRSGQCPMDGCGSERRGLFRRR